jgi:hypothetical protein
MRFHGEPRQIYWLERSENLVDWKVDSLLQSPTGDLWINDPAASSQQYFRLRPLE